MILMGRGCLRFVHSSPAPPPQRSYGIWSGTKRDFCKYLQRIWAYIVNNVQFKDDLVASFCVLTLPGQWVAVYLQLHLRQQHTKMTCLKKSIHSRWNFSKGGKKKEIKVEITDTICQYQYEPLTIASEAGMQWFTIQFSTATVSVSIKPPILTRCNNFFCFITNVGPPVWWISCQKLP